MTRYHIKVRFLLIPLLLLGSCTKDFEEINTNPTAPNQVEPSLLLRQVLWNAMEEISYEGFVAGNLLGQYFTAIDFNLFDRHSLTEPQFGGNLWPILYRNLRDNQIILDQSQKVATYAVYEGPARIMKAYLSAMLTDLYGDLPYSEALRGPDGLITPTYDPQEMIYLGEEGILDNLNKAVEAIGSYKGAQALGGDILFNGNLAAWIRFANSLRIKYLMRISDQKDVSQQIQQLYQEGAFIQSNTQNASFDFSASQPNNFRMANLRTGDFNLFIMSATAQEIFGSLNDPRVAVFYRPTERFPDEYRGLLNGPDAANLSISVADFSLAGTIFREQTDRLDGTYMSAWETYFLLAEAAQKGWLAEDPKILYDQAVGLAFAYWGVAMPANYLNEGPAAFGSNAQDGLAQIITQKWIASSTNGYEGWIEYRRTGFPALKTIAASLNDNLIPVRMPYPTDEAALNLEHFAKAAAETNGNSINYPVWWDNK
ncbi:MAG: SusD/RagB family nutrient-binding outer membrane lipoprotein [Saprospiraceae bacterium]